MRVRVYVFMCTSKEVYMVQLGEDFYFFRGPRKFTEIKTINLISQTSLPQCTNTLFRPGLFLGLCPVLDFIFVLLPSVTFVRFISVRV